METQNEPYRLEIFTVKLLKALALGVLGFLLFFSLSIFGVAFTLNSTVLNPKFVTSELNKLDMSSLARSFIDERVKGGELPQELGTSLTDTITRVEPLVKEKTGDAKHHGRGGHGDFQSSAHVNILLNASYSAL